MRASSADEQPYVSPEDARITDVTTMRGDPVEFPTQGKAVRRSGKHGHRAFRSRSRMLIAISILGALAVAVPVAASVSNVSKVPPQTSSARASALAIDPFHASTMPVPEVTAKAKSTIAKKNLPKTTKPTETSKPTVKSVPEPVNSASSIKPGGTITAGNSKANCITLNFPGGALDQSVISAASSLTGVTYNCLGTFANPMPTWADWEAPWMFSTASDNWDAWLAASPAHQVVVGMDLIPQSVSDNSNPLTWEQPCSAGDYNQYATALAQNLVSYGAGSVVIRLGVEANGNWEADYVGTTTQEMNDWAQCYDNEVTAMRAVPGADFLFVWNPNVCTADLPLNEWYPGNSYVDIIGVDAYDEDCSTLKTVSQEGWEAYSTDSAVNAPNDPSFPSLDNIEAFAATNGKPLSFPEWGLDANTSDDPTYVADMAQMLSQNDFAFESYFDSNSDGIAPLGSTIPNATAAYSQAFK
jgi:Glycosyl hydrolase family 26